MSSTVLFRRYRKLRILRLRRLWAAALRMTFVISRLNLKMQKPPCKHARWFQRVDKPFGTEGLKAPSDEGAVAVGD